MEESCWCHFLICLELQYSTFQKASWSLYWRILMVSEKWGVHDHLSLKYNWLVTCPSQREEKKGSTYAVLGVFYIFGYIVYHLKVSLLCYYHVLFFIPDIKNYCCSIASLSFIYSEQSHFLFHKGSASFEIAFPVEQVTLEIPRTCNHALF